MTLSVLADRDSVEKKSASAKIKFFVF